MKQDRFEDITKSLDTTLISMLDGLGRHACEEYGHPEMRCLPDGTFHCPVCGSGVLPIDASSSPSKPRKSTAIVLQIEPTSHTS